METPFTLTIHGITLAGIAFLVGKALTEHKIWIRMKDRLNSLWRKHCEEIGEHFEPLDNGK